MLTFLSRNLGVRRLALVLAIIAGVTAGCLLSIGEFKSLEQQRWANKYFKSEVAKHPEWTLHQNEDGWYLYDGFDKDLKWRVAESFPRTVDHEPTLWEYLVPFGALLGGGVLMWLVVHTIAWVISGFRPEHT
jgi:hypothetical protein